VVLFTDPAEQPWFWETAVIVAGVVLLLNLLLIGLVFGHRFREIVRTKRVEEFRVRFAPVLRGVEAGDAVSIERLRRKVGRLNELERPVAASMLLEHLRTASPKERTAVLQRLDDTGALAVIQRGTNRRLPWRRALSIRMLGWLGAEEGVAPALAHLEDPNRHVRDSSVRALGRIGDPRSVPALERLYLDPDAGVAAGFLYEAVIAFGPAAEPVLREGLSSPDTNIRVSSCFGIATVLAPEEARPVLAQMLADEAATVRAAAAETLNRIGGRQAPAELVRAAGDEHRSVRREAVTALGSFHDPAAVERLLTSLADPDRLTVVRAGESLVRLGSADRSDTWPVERARTLASLGAL